MALCTRERGVLRGVAKGAKRERSKFCGGFEAPTRGVVSFSAKPTEGLTLLTSWDLVETYPAMRTDLRCFRAGMAMVELVYHALQAGDPHPGLFDSLSGALSTLREPRLADHALLGLLWAVLQETGHRPELDTDVRTGEALGSDPIFGFSARLGGTIKDEGAGRVDREGGPVWRVRSGTIGLLRALSRGEMIGGAEGAVVARATSLLGSYYREVFRVEPMILRDKGPGGSEA